MTPRAIRAGRESSGTAGRHRGPTIGVRVALECWSTPQAMEPGASPLGELVYPAGPLPERESPWRAGRPRRTSDPGLSRPGQLVDTVGPGPRARVTWDSLSTLRAIGPEPESPGKAGLPHGPSDLSASCPVQLVDIAGLRHGPETPGRAVRHRRHWNTAPAPTRYVVEPASHWSQERVLRDHWLTLQALGPKPDRPGERVNPAGPRNGARITKECWSTPQALGRERESPRRSGGPASTQPKPESPGGTGQTRGPSDPSASCPGVLVDPVGPRNRARVARESWWTTRDLGQ